METPPRSEGDPEAERAARLAALRRLGAAPEQRQPPAAPAAARSGAPRLRGHQRRAWTLAIAGSVVLVALIAFGASLLAHARLPQPTTAGHPSAQRYIQIAPREARLNCPVDIAWSPDGQRVAVLGYQDHCPDWPPNAAYTSGLLLIYNAKTGALEQRIALDQFVTGAGGVALDTHTQYVAYQALMWSPDGARLALPFFAQRGMIAAPDPVSLLHGANPATMPHPIAAGVLLLDANTFQRTELVTAPYTASESSTAPLEWNLITHNLIHSALQLPPALGYHWGAGGALLPDSALISGRTAAPPPLTPVGDPAGDAHFTVWQPGVTRLGFIDSNGIGTAVPGLDLYFARFAAWSPDGAYLLAPAYYGGRVDTFQLPQPTAEQIQAAGWGGAPVLPARDAALTALYGPTPRVLTVSWSPDGQRLAAWDGGAIGARVNVYDARTGKVATTLPAPAAASSQLDVSPSYVGEVMRWSPDGKHLALMSLELSSLVIWSVA